MLRAMAGSTRRAGGLTTPSTARVRVRLWASVVYSGAVSDNVQPTQLYFYFSPLTAEPRPDFHKEVMAALLEAARAGGDIQFRNASNSPDPGFTLIPGGMEHLRVIVDPPKVKYSEHAVVVQARLEAGPTARVKQLESGGVRGGTEL